MNKDQLFAKAIQNIATKELTLVKSANKIFDFTLVENIFNQLQNCVLMMSVGRWLAKQLPKGKYASMLYCVYNDGQISI